MQRIGRVNRIGSLATRVFIYNFYPTTRVDDDIELRKKATPPPPIMKLQAFHSALGEDSQIYSTDEEVDTFGLFEKTTGRRRARRAPHPPHGVAPLSRRKPRTVSAHREAARTLPRGAGRPSPRARSTVAFIRNAHRDAFYRVRPDTDPEEISFTEAAREFRAHAVDEAAIPPSTQPTTTQVNAATAAFREAVVADTLAPLSVEAKQGPQRETRPRLCRCLPRLRLHQR